MSVNRKGLAISQTNRARKRRKNSGLLVLLLVGGVATSLTGCSAWTGVRDTWKYNRYWNGMVMGYRNQSSASKAWHAHKHQFCNEKYLNDFARGFKAGYAAIADGADGCTPSFAPREYWGWKYQSCEGQARVAAWFAGYPHGARAAEEAGVGNWTQIQTSAQIQQQYVQHGRLNESYQGIYPIPQQAVQPQAQPYGMPIGTQAVETIESEIPVNTPIHLGPSPDVTTY